MSNGQIRNQKLNQFHMESRNMRAADKRRRKTNFKSEKSITLKFLRRFFRDRALEASVCGCTKCIHILLCFFHAAQIIQDPLLRCLTTK